MLFFYLLYLLMAFIAFILLGFCLFLMVYPFYVVGRVLFFTYRDRSYRRL